MEALSITERDKLCTELLNQYLFSRVWNDSVSEFRTNIKPLLLKTTSCIGSFTLLDSPMRLPTTDPYYVWCVATEDLSIGLDIPYDRWVTAQEITETTFTLMHMYHSTGVMMHKSKVYFRQNESNMVLYVIVDKDMYKTMLQVSELDHMYLTIYHDRDYMKNIWVRSIMYDASDKDALLVRYEMEKFLKSAVSKEGVTVYLNGMERTNSVTALPELNTGDYLDIIIDDNVVFSFDVDVTTTSENPVYLSDQDDTWKQIVHIPKALNPDNRVYTYNTMDFYVRKTFSESKEGLYLHTLAGDPGMAQITHNDVGIGLFVLDAYRDKLMTNEVTIHVKVRRHNNDNVLIDEASYIKLLYSQDDEYIVNMLRGVHDIKEITWWKASELEKSKYVKMMFNAPAMPEIEHLPSYVEALGFYQVIDLICHRIQDSIVTDAYAHKYNYIIPLLYRNHQVVPLTYLNGKLLAKDKYTCYHNGDGTVDIELDNNLIFRPGDMFTTIFYMDNPYPDVSFRFTPEALAMGLSISHPHFDVYHAILDDVMVKGISMSSRVSYRKLLPSLDYVIVDDPANTGGYLCTMSNAYIGATIVLHPKDATYHNSIELDTNGDNIVIPLMVYPYESTNPVPVVDFNNIAVYVNGSYLIRDMDYTIVTTTNEIGNPMFSEIVIQTMDHFSPDNGPNYMEYVVNMAETADTSAGYLLNDTFVDESPVNLFFENTSVLHISGAIVRDGINTGVSIQVPKDVYPVIGKTEIQTSLPPIVTEFIEEYINDTDTERRRILNKYFIEDPIDMPDVLMLKHKHRVYSIFMNKIISDLISGDLIMVEDPDIYRVNEAIDSYLYLKEHDLVFNNRNASPTFTDWYPQYVNYTVSPSMKKLIDRLIKLLMPENKLPTSDVIHILSDTPLIR